MSKEAILGAIRRGLKRGPLPADQRAMLEGRLATHPRHLIPARSRVSRPEQIALFIRNVEKEFGTVARVPNFAAIPQAVADYLVSKGVDAARISSIGLGESEHIAPNDTEAGRAQNRRVTLRFTGR